ncbi:NusG domain II-containing protein [Laedolimicola intestinihominis]|uniref:NusG domain II-containing protein n=1 Tax=Laedolimicola intestinihominis TaxID=3133166 RepID=A0ABV1FLM5_9FIRM
MEEGTKTGQNRKAVYIVAALCAVLFLGGIGGMIWNLTRSHGRQVEILQDGKILYTLDLAQAEDQTFTVTYGGRTNEIEIRDHQIRVKAADCPDQICVHMDWLEAAPIVCLPNRLSIQYADGEGASGLDAVAN